MRTRNHDARHLQVGDTVYQPDGTTRDLMQNQPYAIGLHCLTWADRSQTIAAPSDQFTVVQGG